MITPIEIRQHNFKRSLRGYDMEEVKAFLQTVSEEWEKLLSENRKISAELNKVQAQYASLKELETMLHKTLQKAEQSSKAELENARQKADLKMKEAENRSREILKQGIDERNRVETEIADLVARRDEILVQLKLFLKTQMDRLSMFERKDMFNSNRIVMAELESVSNSLFGAETNGHAKNKMYDDLADEL